MVVTILPLLALILYNANIADEQFTLPSYLSSYMVLSTLGGTILLQRPLPVLLGVPPSRSCSVVNMETVEPPSCS